MNGRAFCLLLPTAMLLAAATVCAQTNPYGKIWETDGVPQDLGNGQLGWGYSVENTSSGNITSVRLENVFSTTAPVLTLRPNSFWAFSATAGSPTNIWTVEFMTTNPSKYIQPTESANFGFRTTYDVTNHTLVTGPRPGAVMFEAGPGFWYSPDVSGLIGPVGEVPANAPTMTVSSTVYMSVDQDLSRSGMQYLISYVVNNTSPDGTSSGGSQYNMLNFTLPVGLNSRVYQITKSSGWLLWQHTLGETNVLLYGNGRTLNVGQSGTLNIYFDAALVQTNAATALASGTFENPNLPFAPVAVVLPDGRPVLGGLAVSNATVSLTATNLAGGQDYTLEQSATLAGWTNALTFTATNAGHTLTLPATNASAQFFRLRSP